MKLIFLFLTALCFFSSWGYAQTADRRVKEMIENRDWFLLDEAYPALKDSIQSPVLKGMAEMLLKKYFNQMPDILENIDFLLINYQKELEDQLSDVLICKSEIIARMGYYADAADYMRDLVDQLLQFVPKDNLANLIAFTNFYNDLRDIQPYYLWRSDKDIEVPFTLEKVGRGKLMFIPVNIHGNVHKFVFDIGSAGMVLSQRLADSLGLEAIVDSAIVRGSIGPVIGKVAYIDSLYVGGILYLNSLVRIIPPDPEIDSIYQVDAVLGTDFMNLVGEVQIYPKENKLIFPVQYTDLPTTGRNMIIDGGLYYVNGYSGNDRLKMILDCGCVESELYPFYYEKYRDQVDLRGKKDTISAGGIGGYRKIPVLHLDSIHFRLGDRIFPLRNIEVHSTEKEVYESDTDGLLGMDFILSFSKVTISFRKMFIKVG